MNRLMEILVEQVNREKDTQVYKDEQAQNDADYYNLGLDKAIEVLLRLK